MNRELIALYWELGAHINQRIAVGQAVLLDASASIDSDGDVLTARWQVIQAPVGSTARVDGNTLLSNFTAVLTPA